MQAKAFGLTVTGKSGERARSASDLLDRPGVKGGSAFSRSPKPSDDLEHGEIAVDGESEGRVSSNELPSTTLVAIEPR